MKLRISGNSIRLRLTRSEVGRLEKDSRLEEVVEFGSNTLAYAVAVRPDAEQPVASYRNNKIEVQLPAPLAHRWASTDEVAISADQPLSNGQVLQVLIEKDFKCAHKGGAENEDAYPNPMAPELR